MTKQFTVTPDKEAKMDHHLLITDILLCSKPQPTIPPPKPPKIYVPRKDLTDDQFGHIVTRNIWPKRPFNLVAKMLGLTTTIVKNKIKAPNS